MGGQNAGLLGALTILSQGHQILAAVSYSPELSDRLKALGIPLFDSIKKEEFRQLLHQADVLISVHGKEIVPKELLHMPPLGCVNVHPYLYQYKGSRPVERALQDGNFKGSVGAHMMVSKVDEGQLIHEEYVDVSGSQTVIEIYNKLYPTYVTTVQKLLRSLSDGKINQ